MSNEESPDTKSIGEVESELADLAERVRKLRLDVAELNADFERLQSDVQELRDHDR